MMILVSYCSLIKQILSFRLISSSFQKKPFVWFCAKTDMWLFIPGVTVFFIQPNKKRSENRVGTIGKLPSLKSYLKKWNTRPRVGDGQRYRKRRNWRRTKTKVVFHKSFLISKTDFEGSDEDEPKAVKPKSGKRGRPKGSGNKRRLDDEPETTVKRPRPRKPRGKLD